MKIATFGYPIKVCLLVGLVSLLALLPGLSRADAVMAPGTESSAGGVTDAWLVKRGLIGHGMIGENTGTDLIMPPAGTTVSERLQTENQTGVVLTRVKSWDELVADDTIHIEITTLSATQFEIAFWLFPNHRKGCTMFQWTLYDHRRALQSRFWRNDATVMRLAGAADLPHDLYPDSVPWAAFIRVLAAPRNGAEGLLNQQMTPYSYVSQKVTAKGPEEIGVPAGTFTVLKVIAQVDITTVMPNWPRFVLHAIEPVVPKNILYFESTPPYRLIKQEGVTFVGGPAVTTELVRFYVVAAPPAVAVGPAVRVPRAPAAVFDRPRM